MSNNEEQSGKDMKQKVVEGIETVKFIYKYRVVLIIAAAVLVIIFLAAAQYQINLEEEDDVNEAKEATITRAYSSNPDTKKTDDEGNEFETVVIAPNEDFSAYEIVYNNDEDYIKETRKKIQQQTSISPSDFEDYEIGILGALMDNGADLDYYTEKQLHCFPLFIIAEASTQNLDLRPNSEKMKDEDGDGQVEYVPQKAEDLLEEAKTTQKLEVPGTILVQRTNTEEANRNQEPVVLEYKNQNDFEGIIQGGDKDEAVKYFTVNDKGELVYATWSYELVDTYDANDSSKEATYPSKLPDNQKVEEKDEYKLSTNKIAFDEYVKEYIMPFEFLVQLLVISTEPEFCTELVDYVLDSKIIINIQEEESIIEEYETREYDQIVKETKQIDYELKLEGTDSVKESKANYYLGTKTDPKNSNIKYTKYEKETPKVTIYRKKIQHTYKWEFLEVDNWIVHLTKEYGEIKETTKTSAPASTATPQEVHSLSKVEEYNEREDTENKREKDEHVEVFIAGKDKQYNNQSNGQVNTKPSVKVEAESNLDNGTGYVIKIEGYEPQEYETNLSSEAYTTPGVIAGDLPLNFTITLNGEIFTYEKQEITERDPYTGVEKTEYKYEVISRESSKYECNVSKLVIRYNEKIDMKRTNCTSTTTKYQADSNPTTEKKYYAAVNQRGESEPGSGHGDKDTTYQKFLLAYDNNGYTRNQIDSAELWLYEMMEKRESTIELIDTVKYLLHMYDGRNTGVTELEGYEGFEKIFKTSGFKGTGSTSNLSTFIRQFSHSTEAPKTADGKYYIMYGDGIGWPTIGNADLQWKSNYTKFNCSGRVLENGIEKEVENVAEYVNQKLGGYDVTLTDSEIENLNICIEVNLVDDIGDEVQKSFYEAVETEVDGLDLSKQQKYALITIIYDFGYLPTRNNYTFEEVYLEASKKYEKNSWQHNKFVWDNWWAYVDGGSPGHIKERDAAFETYVKGVWDFSTSDAGEVFGRNYYIYYTQEQLNSLDDPYDDSDDPPILPITRNASNEEEIFTYEEAASGGTIIECCELVMQELLDKNATYKATHWNDIEASSKSDGAVCATYVSLVLYKAGVLTEEHINKYNYNYCWQDGDGVYSMLHDAGWIEVGEKGITIDEMEPGDVFLMDDHVCIYAGDDYVYDQTCGVYSSDGTPPKGEKFKTATYWLTDYSRIMVFRAP